MPFEYVAFVAMAFEFITTVNGVKLAGLYVTPLGSSKNSHPQTDPHAV